MTVNGKLVQIPIRNKMHTVVTGAALTATLLLESALAFGQQDTPSVVHFLDSNTDRVPMITTFPSYPSIARRDRIQGQATVCFMIRQDGGIRRVSLKDATHNLFKKPALRAIKKSTFEALTPNQVLGTAKTCRTYRFKLEPILVADAVE
jgi:TonB family protein